MARQDDITTWPTIKYQEEKPAGKRNDIRLGLMDMNDEDAELAIDSILRQIDERRRLFGKRETSKFLEHQEIQRIQHPARNHHLHPNFAIVKQA